MTLEIKNGRPVGYLTVAEYAEKAGITMVAVRQRIKRKQLIPLKLGSRNYILKEDVYKKQHPGRKTKECK